MNVGTLMLDLVACLRSEMEEQTRRNPDYRPVCVLAPQWGDAAQIDWCGPEVECGDLGCGQAWVRFATLTPDPEIDPRAMKCVMGFIITLDIGIGRCSATANPGTDPNAYEPPTEDDYTSDFLGGIEDFAVLQRTIACCMEKYKRYGLSIVTLAPFGPEGGCYGTSMLVTVKGTV